MPVIYESIIWGESIRLRLGEGEDGFHLITEQFFPLLEEWHVRPWDCIEAQQIKEELIIKLFTQDKR